MYWHLVNYAIGSLLSLLFGLFVLYRGQSRMLTRKTWFFLCVFVCLWHAGKFLIATSESETSAFLAIRVMYVGAILIPPFYLHFILSILEAERRDRLIIHVAYGFGVLELVLLFTGLLLQGVRPDPVISYYEVPASPYWIYFANYLIFPALAIGKLILTLRSTELVVRKNQFKYVIYSSFIGFICGATSFAPLVTDRVPQFLAPLVYFYTLPITYAVAR